MLQTRPPTQVHVHGPRPLRVGHVLVDGVKDLLLDLRDGVTVQHLHWDLRAVLVVGVDAVQDLQAAGEGEPERVEGGDEGSLAKAPSLPGDVGCPSACASLSFTSLPSANNNLSHSARLFFLREPGLDFPAPGRQGAAVTLDPGILASEMALGGHHGLAPSLKLLY